MYGSIDVKVAQELGAHASFNVAEDGVVRAIKDVAGGKGFDVVIECAEVEGALDTCVDLVRGNGAIYVYAVHTRPETVSTHKWQRDRPEGWSCGVGRPPERLWEGTGVCNGQT